MFNQTLFTLIASIVFATSSAQPIIMPVVTSHTQHVLAVREMPMNDRYPVQVVSDVFRDNILLTISYLSGATKQGQPVDWNAVRKPFTYDLTLKPGEVFAFHDDVLSAYAGKKITTTHVHFGPGDGFVSDGYLYGDGVCHLASVMNWAARDAGLQVESPTPHDFTNIPDVPKKYGTAIYSDGGKGMENELQNLYITNNKDKPVHMVFTYKDNVLKVT